ASRSRVRPALRAALEYHHVAPLPRGAHLRRAARCLEDARLRHLRRPGRVRQGGVPGREHGRPVARRLHALPRGAGRGAGGAGRVTAVILAAGVGKRLLGTSGGKPKCLIEIAGRSLLLRLLDGLAAAGVREAVVVTGFGDDLVRAVLSAGVRGIDVRCVTNTRFREGAILSLWTARDALD